MTESSSASQESPSTTGNTADPSVNSPTSSSSIGLIAGGKHTLHDCPT